MLGLLPGLKSRPAWVGSRAVPGEYYATAGKLWGNRSLTMTATAHGLSSGEEPTMRDQQLRRDGNDDSRRCGRFPAHRRGRQIQHLRGPKATRLGPRRRLSFKFTGVITAIASALLFALSVPAGASAATWHIEQGRAIEDPPPDNLLLGDSCASKICVAVGYNGHGNFQGTLVETLDKSRWTVTPSPITASPFIDDSLNAVSCSSGTSCAAVGTATDVTGTRQRTLVLRLTKGTWRLSPSPNTKAALNSLASISCASRASCVAVGYDGTPSFQQTLVESLIRGTWRVTPSPVAAPPYVVNFLNAVSCISPTRCVAAGFAADPTGMASRTLIETLSGGSWRITPSPNTSSPINELYGVHCTSSGACVAVGDDGTIAAQKTLVETLSGATWRLTPSPNTPLALNELFYAWCRSRTSCGATGYAMNSQGTQARTLIETLRGSTWSVTPSPDTASPLNELYGYSCTSLGPRACYAVGVEGTTTAQEALIETNTS